jgi:hypothetical protein
MPKTHKGPGIIITSDTLTPGLKKFPNQLQKAIGKYMNGQDTRVQDYARTNAPWTDRTGNARNGLFAEYQGPGSAGLLGGNDRHTIRLYHTMPYGIWLEVIQAGKYAIIFPTVVHEGERIMGGLKKLINKMNGVDFGGGGDLEGLLP